MNFRKKLQHNFPKMSGWGGSKAVWNFSENSSVLEGVSFPNDEDDDNDENDDKGRLPLPKRMNFRKSSTLPPPPPP